MYIYTDQVEDSECNKALFDWSETCTYRISQYTPISQPKMYGNYSINNNTSGSDIDINPDVIIISNNLWKVTSTFQINIIRNMR